MILYVFRGGGGGVPVYLNYFPMLAVHGVWEEWSPWSLCSFTCGRGHRTRTRVCTPPQHGGRGCDGPETQSKLCNIALCPGLFPLSFTLLIDFELSLFSLELLTTFFRKMIITQILGEPET